MASITFDTIVTALNSSLSDSETNINTLISNMGANPSTVDTLNMQVAVQKYTMIANIQSTVVKDVADTLKSIISKAS